MHKKIITAAANSYKVITPDGDSKDIILVDNCHMGRNMQEVITLLHELGCTVTANKERHPEDRAQGFITESGVFVDRSEGYKIAKSSGQPFNDEYTLPHNKLDSSCIRHFKEGHNLKDYMPKDSVVMQPLEIVKDVVRFKRNLIVEHLLDNGGMDMNYLAIQDFPQEDREQFAQLIGYSLHGYGTLSYVTDESYDRAEEMYEKMRGI